jgi:acetyl-CoA acetyltransferase
MPVVVLEAVRTPLGAVHGALAAVHPVELLAATLRELAVRAPALWDLAGAGPDAPRGATTGADVVVGCVEQVGGQAGNVARAAVLAAGWPGHTAGSTIDRGPVSGAAALAHAVALVASGASPVAVAAAVDVPSLVPPGAAAMGRYPYGRPWEGALDGTGLAPPGRAAEALGVARTRQDDWARRSVTRAAAAVAAGTFAPELVTLAELAADELPPGRAALAEDLAGLPPMFDEGATLTAGNTAPDADGAAAVLVADAAVAAQLGLTPLAEVAALSLRAGAPGDLAGATVDAATTAAHRSGVAPAEAATVELGEPSAAVAVALADALGLEPEDGRVNPSGGPLGLGDPTATSSLRATVSLVQRLRREELATGFLLAAGTGDGAALVLRRR